MSLNLGLQWYLGVQMIFVFPEKNSTMTDINRTKISIDTRGGKITAFTYIPQYTLKKKSLSSISTMIKIV